MGKALLRKYQAGSNVNRAMIYNRGSEDGASRAELPQDGAIAGADGVDRSVGVGQAGITIKGAGIDDPIHHYRR
jgi:hypothetical protein